MYQQACFRRRHQGPRLHRPDLHDIHRDRKRRALRFVPVRGREPVHGHEQLRLADLLSDAVIGRVLLVWLYVKYALARAYKFGLSEWHSAGIGCLAIAPAFNVLPLALLPRLQLVLLALWTVGCEFEGEQLQLSRAWFVVYPSIIELIFFYYSILDAIAKLFGRRMSDAHFGVLTVALCALHWYRQDLMRMRWLGVDGRVSSLVTRDELKQTACA